MPDWIAPLASPADWSYTFEPRVLPAESSFAGTVVHGVRCERAGADVVLAPAESVVSRRQATVALAAYELTPNPFAYRAVASHLPGGAVTMWVEAVHPVSPTDAPKLGPGQTIARTTSAWIGFVDQQRAPRPIAEWSALIRDALDAVDLDSSSWTALHVAIEAAQSDRPRVVLLDHALAPVGSGRFAFSPIDGAAAGDVHELDLAETDLGDLQAAVERQAGALGIDQIFVGGASRVELRRAPADPTNDRWAVLPAARAAAITSGGGSIEIERRAATATVASLADLLAPQQAADLQDFTTGNRLVPIADGKLALAAVADALLEAAGGAGPTAPFFHLAAYRIEVDFELRPRTVADPTGLTLRELLEALAASTPGAGDVARILVNRIIPEEVAEVVPDAVLVAALVVLTSGGLNRFLDAVGTSQIGLLWAAALLGLAWLAKDRIAADNNESAQAALEALDRVSAPYSNYPATLADNPLAAPLFSWLDDWAQDIDRFGTYHQKFAVVNTGTRLLGFAGGVDINPNRRDDSDHAVRGPYHDVHAMVEGPAAEELEATFLERWEVDVAPITPPPVPPVPADGPHIVQVARTYYEPSGAPGLPFAPTGERTIFESTLRAIESARHYIYIEDQYFSGTESYRAALVDAIGRVDRLVVTAAANNDQIFGAPRRHDLVAALKAADPTGDVVRIGSLYGRYRVPFEKRRATSGKLHLQSGLPAGPVEGQTVRLAPARRVPEPPFWLAIEGELMLAAREPVIGEIDRSSGVIELSVLRGHQLRTSDRGLIIEPREHAAGAAATVVRLRDIFVHAKIMIVDDLLVSIGSANVNRRGYSYDGELNLFCISEGLRADAGNPARDLRIALWAEHLGIPREMAPAVLADPIAACDLFDRPYLAGNRFVDHDAFPIAPTFKVPLTSNVIGMLVGALTGRVVIAPDDLENLWNVIVDPTSIPD